MDESGFSEGSTNGSDDKRSRRHHAWLHQELGRWLGDNIINAEQASALAARYPLPTATPSWGKIIISAFGAIILGLGVILVFAYNWQGMHRLTKLALVLVAVIGAHGLGLRFYSCTGRDRPGARSLGESFHLLGSMLFGAGIWLIAQIYHIDSHYPNGILLWALGCLAMAWALQSVAQALLALTLIGLWGVFELFDFSSGGYSAFWLIALGIAPLAWLKRSPLLLFFTTLLLAISFFASTIQLHDDWIIAALMSMAIIYVLGGKALASSELVGASSAIAALGWIVYLLMLFLFTFDDVAREVRPRELSASAWVNSQLLLPCFLAFGLLLWFFYRLPAMRKGYEQFTIVLLALSFGLLIWMHLFEFDKGFAVLLGNLLLLSHGCVFLVKGMDQLDWRRVAVGGVILASLVFARFMDLFDSLLLRAFVFMALGGALLALGWIFSHRKSQQEERANV